MLDPRLEAIVEAVSDGEQIDWASVQRWVTHPEARGQCVHLETLWKISRDVRHSDVAPPPPPKPPWTQSLIAVAMLQVLLGLIGSALYRPYSLPNLLRVLTVLSFASVGLVLRRTWDNSRARDLGIVFIFTAFGFGRSPYVAWFDAWFADDTWLAMFRTGFLPFLRPSGGCCCVAVP